MPEDWNVPMFETPERYRKPQAAEGAPRWGKHRGPRTTCELCILDIRAGRLQTTHETVTETYTVGSRVWRLCSTHRTEIKYRGRELPCTEP